VIALAYGNVLQEQGHSLQSGLVASEAVWFALVVIKSTALESLCEATPGMTSSVHLNHAGGSLIPGVAKDALIAHLGLESQIGPQDAGLEAATRLEEARASAAKLINAEPDEIAFATSGSSAFGAVFSALPRLNTGDRILVGRQEWGGNLSTYERAAERAGASVEAIPCRDDGGVDVEALAGLLDDRVKLVSLTWLPANGGLINDAAAVGSVARAGAVPYLIDAGQALGQVSVDVQALHCDILVGAGRKHLRGPRGTGLLYVRRALLQHLDPPYVDVLSPWSITGTIVRPDARRFETSECSFASLLAFGASIDLALEVGPAIIEQRVQGLAQQLRERLSEIPRTQCHDLGSGPQSGIVSFAVAGLSPLTVKKELADLGIRIGASPAAYTPLDMTERGLDSVARISLSYLNTVDDLDRLCSGLRGIAKSAS
jgi:cysteine desulfurase / selenocysteine lyase